MLLQCNFQTYFPVGDKEMMKMNFQQKKKKIKTSRIFLLSGNQIVLTDEELSSPAATIRVLRSSGQVNSLDLLRSFCVEPPTHWLTGWQVHRLASVKIKAHKSTGTCTRSWKGILVELKIMLHSEGQAIQLLLISLWIIFVWLPQHIHLFPSSTREQGANKNTHTILQC